MNYTIKKVSEMTGLSIPTIRYYDKEGLLPDLQRKESGYRIFQTGTWRPSTSSGASRSPG